MQRKRSKSTKLVMDPKSVYITFGKHKGESVETVYNSEKGYLDWCMRQQGIVSKYPQLIAAISACINNNTNNPITNGSLAVVSSQTISESNINENSKVAGVKKIEYGEYINFSENRIRETMKNLNVRCETTDKFFILMRRNGNINREIAKYADKMFEDPEQYEYVKSVLGDEWEEVVKSEISKDEWEDVFKICLAWKYGIINERYRATGFGRNSIQEEIIKLWNDDYSMDEIIKILTTKLSEDDEEERNARKYCKKLPYIFTPAMYQLLLLGINNNEMKKLHKCKYDEVMGRVDFPIVMEKISRFYTLDWMNEYYKFVNNPYAFYTLPVERCDIVIIYSGRATNDFLGERHLGEISRFVYKNTKDNRWSATPDWLMMKEYPDYIKYIDILRENYGLIFDMKLVYLKHIHGEEEEVASFIRSNITLEVNGISPADVRYSEELNPTEEQDNAIRTALSKSTSIITGLAGTGKTTIIKEIVRHIINKNRTFIVCSFTAKAVNRVRAILGKLGYAESSYGTIWHVRTIHSLIHSIQKEKLRNSKERGILNIPEYLIIDEATTVSLSLFSHLVRLFRNTDTKVIMLGDINQLPPIKYGRPFEDIINSGLVEINVLTKNVRVRGGEDDPIIINSTNIVRSPIYIPTQAANFIIIENRSKDGMTADFIRNILRSNNVELKDIKDHKFITALNDDCIELNRILSSLLGNQQSNTSRKISCLTNKKDTSGNKIAIEIQYSIGDPVIFTKNGFYKYVSNGSEGIIIGITSESMIVEVNNTDNIQISVPLLPLRNKPGVFTVKNMALAYCITVHKAQGSQWKNVYYYIKGRPSKKFLHKRLTYTALTRASEKCTVIESFDEYDRYIFTSCCREQIGVHYGGLVKKLSLDNIPIVCNSTENRGCVDNLIDIMDQLNINSAGNIVLS